MTSILEQAFHTEDAKFQEKGKNMGLFLEIGKKSR
jgi:hypothetical protein